MHTMIIINTGTMNFETIKKDERLIIILNDWYPLKFYKKE
jgi:hypothetical protein